MPKTVKESTRTKEIQPKEKYYYAVGRRKEAVAQVRLYKGKGHFVINEKEASKYFPKPALQLIIWQALKLTGNAKNFDVSVRVKGGGFRGQAEAIRLGISRALLKFDTRLRKTLRSAGFLTRDSRVKERKKYGLKRARRAPQWQKR